jgi:hypothetical protein
MMPEPPTPERIDAWMPRCDASERHQLRVSAPLEAVWQAVLEMDFRRSPLIAVLFGLRSLPGLLRGRRPPLPAPGASLQALERFGFVPLERDAPRELLLGLVGRFWRPSGDIVRLDAAGVAAFDRPGYAIAAWNFTLRPQGEGVLLATETRVRCTDAASRRSFLRYWRLVAPFSGIIRGAMLRGIRRAAESAARAPGAAG